MGAAFGTPYGSFAPSSRGKMQAVWTGGVGANRLPTDPLFFANLTLRNVVAGSRYRITRSDTGTELATGVASGSGLVDVVVSGVPCFSNPQQVAITVRNASGTIKYKVFDTAAFISKSGGEAFILQQED